MKHNLATFALGLTVATLVHAGQPFAVQGEMSDYPHGSGTTGASTAAAGVGASSLGQPARSATADDGHLHTRQDEGGIVSHRDTHAPDPRDAAAERAQAARRAGTSEGTGQNSTRR